MSNSICYSAGVLSPSYIRKAGFCTLLAAILLIPLTALGQTYITNGVGDYSEFNETTLLIKLELEAPATDPVEAIAVDTNKRLSFRMMKDRSPRSWSKIWIQNLSINNSPDTLQTQTNDLIAMTQALKGGLKTGDLVEFERIANDLTIMRVNGQEIADFETPGFFEFLLSAFIGSIPPSSQLKANLLAGGDPSSEMNTLFDSMGYTAERAAQVAKWTAPAAPQQTASSDPAPASEPEPAEDPAPAPEPTPEETEVAADTESAEEGPTQEQEVATAPEPEPEPEVDEEDAPVMITAESLLAVQNYQRNVLQQVYRQLEYPNSALRRNREGSLRVSIGITREGRLASLDVVQNADYGAFDAAAIDAVQAAAPFDPLPEGTMEIPMTLEIPIAFRLQ